MTVEKREVTGCDRIHFRGPGVLKLVQREEEGLTIHAPSYVMDDIESRIEDGELRLGYRSPRVVSLGVHREVISYTLGVIDLAQLHCAGIGGRILVPDLDTDRLRLSISGQGQVILEHLTADSIDVGISGAGVVHVRGDVEDQRIKIDGAGHYNAPTLVSDFALIQISGAGKADVSVSAELDVRISGAGHVTYEGYPEITRSISGLGKLSRRRARKRPTVNGEDHG